MNRTQLRLSIQSQLMKIIRTQVRTIKSQLRVRINSKIIKIRVHWSYITILKSTQPELRTNSTESNRSRIDPNQLRMWLEPKNDSHLKKSTGINPKSSQLRLNSASRNQEPRNSGSQKNQNQDQNQLNSGQLKVNFRARIIQQEVKVKLIILKSN